MSRLRYISIPLNADGEEEYNNGIEDTENIKTLNLSDEEFNFLYSKGVFDDINNQCELLIDDYESEIIDNSKIQTCKEILSSFGDETETFKEAIRLAEANNTFIGLDF
ncbi:hypothetical protein [Anaerophilus nitritogenes]|uniref:hypothetical protein n=1 Tax=Anaerophilus nitritogenes TaxID=2498136 RepID=UPI00101C513D|nr:hypothetical protein [Anaerophilus nitritogenes]